MITLKIITVDQVGQQETFVISGDSIVHKEYFSQDHSISRKAVEENNTLWVIGNMVETSSDQKFSVSEIDIYDEDRNLKNIILVLPKASCYIMDNGKTVDHFFTYYEI